MGVPPILIFVKVQPGSANRRSSMTLREVLLEIEMLDPETAVYAAVDAPLGLSQPVVVAEVTEDDSVPSAAGGMRLVMDVGHMRDTLKGLERLMREQMGRCPSPDELMERFMLYLENDA
jgi:hypothetical protein